MENKNGSIPFSVGWVNSLDGTALDGRDVKRRAWGWSETAPEADY
jgi:hypothetical protein